MHGSFLDEDEPRTIQSPCRYQLVKPMQPSNSEDDTEINQVGVFEINENTSLTKEFVRSENFNVSPKKKLNKNNNSRSNLSLIHVINNGFQKMVNHPNNKSVRPNASKVDGQNVCSSASSSNCESSDSETETEIYEARRNYSKDSIKSFKFLLSQSTADDEQHFKSLFILIAFTLLVNFPLGFIALRAALKARKTKNLKESQRLATLARQYCLAGVMVALTLSSLAFILVYVNNKFSHLKLDHSNPNSLPSLNFPTSSSVPTSERLALFKSSSKPSPLSARALPTSSRGSPITNQSSPRLLSTSFDEVDAKEFKPKVYDRISIFIDRGLSN